MKVLNLYAGIGGNRKLWEYVEVTAVEWDKQIASIYQDFFPDDEVVVEDAHQYLLENFEDYDFIWSSPPCPTHSKFRFIGKSKNWDFVYPDMKLYEEIIFLKYWFDGKWVVENVKSYYEPLIKPYDCENHYFWSNFVINPRPKKERGIRSKTIEEKESERFDLSGVECSRTLKEKILNNCVLPDLGLYVFDCAFKTIQPTIDKYSED